MNARGVVALLAAGLGLISACGSPNAPSPSSFKAGRYLLAFNNGNLVTGAAPCAGLSFNSTHGVHVQFDADGIGFRGRGVGVNAAATLDIRLQVDGNQLTGTISGTFSDELTSPRPGPAVLAFPANSSGALERFVGSFSAALSAGSGSIDGQPTISVPTSPAVMGSCSSGQLTWSLVASAS